MTCRVVVEIRPQGSALGDVSTQTVRTRAMRTVTGAFALSILAAEIVHQRNGQVGLTERHPWLIAFIFGLFHGLGFAGALSEIGVPQHEVPLL